MIFSSSGRPASAMTCRQGASSSPLGPDEHAEAMAAAACGYSGIGALFVIGCFLLNKKSKKPIVDMAIGPVACIIFGILLNILLLIHLV